MEAAPARDWASYNYLIKLLLIGDSGVGKSCLVLCFSDCRFTPSFISTIGIDLKTRIIELDGKQIKLQIWDTAGMERFRTTTAAYYLPAYYRGIMGILMVYDVTNESSFNNIRDWIQNIEQHASYNVNKILVGSKADMDESKRAVPTAKGQALADEYGIKFFETSAKTNLNVEEVFFSIVSDIMQRFDAKKSSERLYHGRSTEENDDPMPGEESDDPITGEETDDPISKDGTPFRVPFMEDTRSIFSASTVESDLRVTVKANYGDDFIVFKLSASSGIHGLSQQVSEGLNLEVGTYNVKYIDDDNDPILIECGDDLLDYISNLVSKEE